MGRPSPNERLYKVISAGVVEAQHVLELLVPVKVAVSIPDLRPVDFSQIPLLIGPSELNVVATYSRVMGDMKGHLVFLYDPATAKRLARLVIGEESAGEDMEESALCEVSNIAGSRVLNFLSNASGFQIIPSAPVLVSDMAGAILQSVLYDLVPFGNNAVVIKTEISLSSQKANGTMILIPAGGGLAALVDRLGRRTWN